MSLVDRIKSLFGGTDAPTESGTRAGAAQSEESAVGNGDSDSDPEPHDPVDSGESDPKSVPADSADAQSNSDEVVNLAKSLSVGETIVINNEMELTVADSLEIEEAIQYTLDWDRDAPAPLLNVTPDGSAGFQTEDAGKAPVAYQSIEENGSFYQVQTLERLDNSEH